MSTIKNTFLRCCLFIAWFFAGSALSLAQGKFSVTGGWGYYERANIGAQWNFSERSSLSLYGGSNIGFDDHMSWTTGLSFDQTFQKTVFWKLKPGYSLGALYWTNEDDHYLFKSLSFPFMSLLAYPVSALVTTRLEGGVILNMVNESVRKQNVEAGYPKRVNGNIRISIIYKLGGK